jgi:hypothetical protein
MFSGLEVEPLDELDMHRKDSIFASLTNVSMKVGSVEMSMAALVAGGAMSGVVWRSTTSPDAAPDSLVVSRGVALGYLQSRPFTKQRLQ